MTSFNDFEKFTNEQWANSSLLTPTYNIDVLREINNRGNAEYHSYAINKNARMFVSTSMGLQLEPTTETKRNNSHNVWHMEEVSHEYIGVTASYKIEAKEDQVVSNDYWLTAVNESTNSLLKEFERVSFVGDGINKGLVSDIVQDGDITFNNAQELFEAILLYAAAFNQDNNKKPSDAVDIYVSGNFATAIHSGFVLNNAKQLERALLDASIKTHFLDAGVVPGSKLFYVNFDKIKASHGVLPSVLRPVQVVPNGKLSDEKYLFVGNQSIAVHRLNTKAVKMYRNI